MDLDALSHSIDGERRITTTARGLMLVRDLHVQTSRETVYDPERGHVLPRWDDDTTFGGLGLTAADVQAWRRGRVLDVASGLGAAATELSLLGAEVDCVDLELGDGHPSFEEAAVHVRARYAEQMQKLQGLVATGDDRYAMDHATRALLDELVGLADAIAARYPGVTGRRHLADARGLSELADDHYDAVLCGWLMCHLEPEDERQVVAAMLRVTRPGGVVHVKAGYGGDAAERMVTWFGSGVTIERARGDLVVLRSQP